MTGLESAHFIGEQVEVAFDSLPAREKTPPCPSGFTWLGQEFHVVEMLAEWSDFTRRGRAARNMRPSHASVGRFYFRVKVEGGRIFDLYYDRAPKDADDRKGAWFLYREME
jgi:hypothetical protein